MYPSSIEQMILSFVSLTEAAWVFLPEEEKNEAIYRCSVFVFQKYAHKYGYQKEKGKYGLSIPVEKRVFELNMIWAAKAGNIPIIEYIQEMRYQELNIYKRWKHRNKEQKDKWIIYPYEMVDKNNLINVALQHGHTHLVDYLLEKEYPLPSYYVLDTCAEVNDVVNFRRFYKMDRFSFWRENIEKVFQEGKLEIIKIILEGQETARQSKKRCWLNGLEMHICVYYAIKNKHFHVLDYIYHHTTYMFRENKYKIHINEIIRLLIRLGETDRVKTYLTDSRIEIEKYDRDIIVWVALINQNEEIMNILKSQDFSLTQDRFELFFTRSQNMMLNVPHLEWGEDMGHEDRQLKKSQMGFLYQQGYITAQVYRQLKYQLAKTKDLFAKSNGESFYQPNPNTLSFIGCGGIEHIIPEMERRIKMIEEIAETDPKLKKNIEMEMRYYNENNFIFFH